MRIREMTFGVACCEKLRRVVAAADELAACAAVFFLFDICDEAAAALALGKA